jgi:cardiolipin synthase
MNRREWLNAANAVTLTRLALVPLLVYLLATGRYGAALWVFLGAALSDAVDGFIARRFHQLTYFGAVLDPAADKLIVVSTVATLAWVGLLPLGLVALIVARDLVIVAGAAAYRGLIGPVEMAPTVAGKFSTFTQLSLVLLVLTDASGLLELTGWLVPAYWVVAAAALVSGSQYVWVWGRKALHHGKRRPR